MFLNQCCPRGQFVRLGAIGFGRLFAFVLSLSVSAAHEGHHGDDQKSAAASSVFPRVTAQSDRYEVVGVLKNGKFSIFVDDAVSNQPVTDVTVQVTIGDTEAIEAERGP